MGHSLAWYIKMGAVVFEGKTRDQLVDLVQKTCAFSVSEREVVHALDILLAANQLSFADGTSQFAGGAITTKWDFDSAAIKKHHRANLNLALETIAWPIDQRFLTSVTVPCNEDLYQTIISEVRALCLSILERGDGFAVDAKEAKQVATLQLALFPYFKF